MKITHYRSIDAVKMASDMAKGVSKRVVIGKADSAENFYMRVFDLEKDGFSPRHSHDWEHEIFIHSGSGEVLCNREWVPVSAGYVIFIPPNSEHQIKNTGDKQPKIM